MAHLNNAQTHLQTLKHPQTGNKARSVQISLGEMEPIIPLQPEKPIETTPSSDTGGSAGPLPEDWGERMTRWPYLTTEDIAEVFQVVPRTIQDWTAKGYLPVIRIGHTTRYKLSDVEAFVDEHFRVEGRSLQGGAM